MKVTERKRYSTIQEIVRRSSIRQAIQGIKIDTKNMLLFKDRDVQLTNLFKKPKENNSDHSQEETQIKSNLKENVSRKANQSCSIRRDLQTKQENRRKIITQNLKIMTQNKKKKQSKPTYLCIDTQKTDSPKNSPNQILIENNEEEIEKIQPPNYQTVTFIRSKKQKRPRYFSKEFTSKTYTSNKKEFILKEKSQDLIKDKLKMTTHRSTTDQQTKARLSIKNIDHLINFKSTKISSFMGQKNQTHQSKNENSGNKESFSSNIITKDFFARTNQVKHEKNKKAHFVEEIPEFLKPSLEITSKNQKRVASKEDEPFINIPIEIESQKEIENEVKSIEQIHEQQNSNSNFKASKMKLSQKKSKLKILLQQACQRKLTQQSQQQIKEQIEIEQIQKKKAKTSKRSRSKKVILEQKLCGWQGQHIDNGSQLLYDRKI